MTAPDPEPRSITQLLASARNDEPTATESLLALAYDELGALARAHLASERRGHTLQPTALVHEAWLKLAGHLSKAADRAQFFAIASQAMRRVLTDHARGRNRQKRGGGRVKVTLDGQFADSQMARRSDGVDFVELDDSLTRLAALNERHARVVELRVFGGLTIAEAATVLEVSHTTIEKDWFTARAWLRTELNHTG